MKYAILIRPSLNAVFVGGEFAENITTLKRVYVASAGILSAVYAADNLP